MICARIPRGEVIARLYLSPKLVPLLGDLFPGTIHAQMTDLSADAEDIAIWEYAKRENFAI